MPSEMIFTYFTDKEADQFEFIRVPKLLVKAPYFDDLTSDARLLYGLMLDRVSLSIKNDWFDEQNRAYILYSVEQVMEDLHCGRNKAIKTLQELDAENGIGLIEKVKKGQGKGTRIYVKNFYRVDSKAEEFTKQTSRSLH